MDWNSLSKGDQKATIEGELARLLDELESSGTPLTDWQKVKLIDALDYTERGAFGIGATAVSHVMAKNVLPAPWGREGRPEGLEEVTIEKLRALLIRLRHLPVQEPIAFANRR